LPGANALAFWGYLSLTNQKVKVGFHPIENKRTLGKSSEWTVPHFKVIHRLFLLPHLKSVWGRGGSRGESGSGSAENRNDIILDFLKIICTGKLAHVV